jgi:membrane fusion protein (multidrug efflux system)
VLPPENATGNWVKVTQRFPVRIGITDPGQNADQPLRAGASATVTVDTTEGSTQDGQ